MDAAPGSAALAAAFPAALAAEVRLVAQVLSPAGSVRVWVQGEHLATPYRLYNPEPDGGVPAGCPRCRPGSCTACTPATTTAASATSARSSAPPTVDRPVRGPARRRIRPGHRDHHQAGARRPRPARHPRHQAYGRFAAASPGFLHLTSQRAASYWNCYYRSRFPLRCYPARLLLDSLKDAAAHCPRADVGRPRTGLLASAQRTTDTGNDGIEVTVPGRCRGSP